MDEYLSAGLTPSLVSSVFSYVGIRPLEPLPADVEADILWKSCGERKVEAFLGELEEDESVMKVGMKLRFIVERKERCILYNLAVDAFGMLILYQVVLFSNSGCCALRCHLPNVCSDSDSYLQVIKLLDFIKDHRCQRLLYIL